MDEARRVAGGNRARRSLALHLGIALARAAAAAAAAAAARFLAAHGGACEGLLGGEGLPGGEGLCGLGGEYGFVLEFARHPRGTGE